MPWPGAGTSVGAGGVAGAVGWAGGAPRVRARNGGLDLRFGGLRDGRSRREHREGQDERKSAGAKHGRGDASGLGSGQGATRDGAGASGSRPSRLPTAPRPEPAANLVRLAGRGLARYTLNQMVQSSTDRLDASFAALSDATRRGVLEQLGRGDASITELADRFHMTLTGMKKHVGVLEHAGLVATQKVGRVRTCRLGLGRLADETAWLEQYRRLWASRFDALDQIIAELEQKERSGEHRETE